MFTYDSIEELRRRGFRVMCLVSCPPEENDVVIWLRRLGAPLYQPVRYSSSMLAVSQWAWDLTITWRDMPAGKLGQDVLERVMRLGRKQEDPETFSSAFLAALEVGGEDGAMSYLDSVGS